MAASAALEAGLFPKSLPVPSLAQALSIIGQKFPRLGPEGKCVKIARKHAKTIDPIHTRGMSEDQILALILYTMEQEPREESLYFLMNAVAQVPGVAACWGLVAC